MTFIIISAFVILVSCNNSDKALVTKEKQVTEETSDNSVRQKLILELKRLKLNIASNEKVKIADIFEFPISNDNFSIYIEDKSYNEQLKSNGNKTTRAMFLQNYEAISENIWLNQLNSLFQYIMLDSLIHKNTLEFESYFKSKPCFYSYQIEVINDRVKLRMNKNSNRDYQSKSQLKEDLRENSSEICEHNFWWDFRFDGNQLHLESISGAD